MFPPTVTPCECASSGWCERHQCRKSAAWHLLCRRQLDYYQLWEAGRGPCLGQASAGAATLVESTTPVPPQPLPPCVHRGDAVLEQVRCELCGRRGVMLPVYACERFERCTESRVRHGQTTTAGQPAVCVACESYVSRADDTVPAEGSASVSPAS